MMRTGSIRYSMNVMLSPVSIGSNSNCRVSICRTERSLPVPPSWTSLCFAPSPGANLFDSPLEFRKVRPRPVDLFAVRTAVELIVIDFGERFEFADYLDLGYRFQRCVTSQAARERRDQFRKVKTADNLNRLFVGVLRPRPISVLNDGVHEETPITRQERSILADHHLE